MPAGLAPNEVTREINPMNLGIRRYQQESRSLPSPSRILPQPPEHLDGGCNADVSRTLTPARGSLGGPSALSTGQMRVKDQNGVCGAASGGALFLYCKLRFRIITSGFVFHSVVDGRRVRFAEREAGLGLGA